MKSSEKKVKKKRRYRMKRILAVFLSVMILAIVGIGGYTFWMFSKINHKTIDKSADALGIDPTYENNKAYADIVNVALFGIDSRGNDEPGHSDAIMILSINRKKNEVKVISLMRDTYVTIEGHGKTKLTEAYFYGGAPLALKTINQNFNLNVTDYVTVNFDSLAKVIDAVGGVTINVTEDEMQNANHNIQEYAGIWNVTPTYIESSGEQVLNGMQAVGYARIRYVGNADFQRTERQRTVMEQMFNKALKMNPLDYPGLLSKILPDVETSLNAEDILGIGTSVMKSGSAQFQQERFPLDKDVSPNDLIDGVSYVVTDLNVTSTKLHDYIFDDVDPNQNNVQSSQSQQTAANTNKNSKSTTTTQANKAKSTATTKSSSSSKAK